MIDQRLMQWDDIQQASDDWRVADGAPGSPFDAWRGKFLPLPDWYDHTIDPLSAEYVHQQDRIWRAMVGEADEYDPRVHEMTNDHCVDVEVRPGLYNASPEAAGHHLIALGHLVQQSGLQPGGRVLEYGAGFGQIALTFARMGYEVHTVDIDPAFCEAMRQQASFFRSNLTAHLGEFGDNPGGGVFDLIVFYECFHHARNWLSLIPRLKNILAPGGKILMAGEPIAPASEETALWCPYPWGIRLDSEVAAITRFRKWYELGFRQDFLKQIFEKYGFFVKERQCNISSYANLFEIAIAPACRTESTAQVAVPEKSSGTLPWYRTWLRRR